MEVDPVLEVMEVAVEVTPLLKLLLMVALKVALELTEVAVEVTLLLKLLLMQVLKVAL
jgi:hypothetical protein